MHAKTIHWLTPFVLAKGRRVDQVDVTLTGWGHKLEVQVGDTVYLRHKDAIRSFVLTAAAQADPLNGKIAVNSPIGRAVLGRRTGQTVGIDTLDGPLEYEILKIV